MGRKRQQETAEQSVDGVLVKVSPNGDGERVDVQALGSVKLTEIPTLLRLAAQLAEKQLGIERG